MLRATAATGSMCKVKLEGKLATDANFVATDGDTIEMTVGHKHILEGLDKHVLGMNVGQTKTVRILPSEARGPLLDVMVMSIPADDLPAGIQEGTNVQIAAGKSAVVTGLSNKFVTLAFEHPWAGKDLDLKVTLVESVTAPDTKQIHVTTIWPGDGRTYPKRGDKVTLHFQTVNVRTNEVIESSRIDGAPVSFTVGEGEIDPGWDEAVMLVSHGETAKIQIPSTMTYGKMTDDDTVMQVQLLEINGKTFVESTRDMSQAPKRRLPTYDFQGSSQPNVFDMISGFFGGKAR